MSRRPGRAAALAAALLAACTFRPVASPPLDPAALAPTRLGAVDDRARFRTVLCAVGDGQGAIDLGPRLRRAWLAARPPAPVPVLALGAFALEPAISALLRPFRRRLAELGYIGDGQVPASFQVPPGARLPGWLAADHPAIVVPFARVHPGLADRRLDRNAFPREILLDAVVRRVEELLLEGGALASPAGHG